LFDGLKGKMKSAARQWIVQRPQVFHDSGFHVRERYGPQDDGGTVFHCLWSGNGDEVLPVLVRTGGLLDKSSPRVGLARLAREIRPTTLQGDIKALAVMVTVHLSVRPFGVSVTFHQNRRRFHFS
jgi:hypothetical protein